LAPADPRSEEECRDYQRQQNAYLKALETQNEQCHADVLKGKSAEFVTVAPPCGGKAVPTPKQCQEVSGAAWCASVGFASKYEQCMKQALAAERKPFDDAVIKNQERQSREAAKRLREQCEADSAMPKPDGCKAVQSGSGFEELEKR
jgi:hypothetical protein